MDDRYQIRVVWESYFQSSIRTAHACANCLTPTKWGNPHSRRPGLEKVIGVFHQRLRFKNTILLWMTNSWPWEMACQSQIFTVSRGLKNTTLRGSGATRWRVKFRTFLWWLIPDKSRTRKLFWNLNPARVGTNRPTSPEQRNPHGRRPDIVKFDKVKEGFNKLWD